MRNNFECKKCGKCCKQQEKGRNVVLYERDISSLSKFLKITIQEFIERYTIIFAYEYKFKNNSISDTRIVLKFNNSKECFFLKDNICSVHFNKPLQCKLYPYTISQIVTGIKNKSCNGIYSISKDNSDLIKGLKIQLKEEDNYKMFLRKYFNKDYQSSDGAVVNFEESIETYFENYKLIINQLN